MDGSLVEAIQATHLIDRSIKGADHLSPTITLKDCIKRNLLHIIYKEKWNKLWRIKIVILALRLL